MRIHPDLRAEVRPVLKMTPAVQAALELLQIPTLELRVRLNQEILGNPALELEEPEDDPAAESCAGPAPSASEAAPGHDRAPAAADEAADAAREEQEPEAPEWLDGLDSDPAADGCPELQTWIGSGRGEPSREAAAVRRATCFESLQEQLRLATSDPTLLSTAEYLIGSLDERGYLSASLSVFASDLGVPLSVVEQALALVQGLEPPGIGARDLRECLLLQLRARGRERSLAWRVVERGFPALVGRRREELARSLRAGRSEIEEALAEIRRLVAHPGALVSAPDVRYIYPDLIVESVGSGYEVYANERALPRLRISRSCRELLRGRGAEEAARQYALSRLRSARWLVRALDRRRSTMLRVMQCLVEEQREFFRGGVARLRPMTLQTVARRLGLHESTVARATAGKYVETPRGIFPMKFFFSGAVATRLGEAASSRAVRERIRSLVEEEDKSRPRRDQEIAEILQAEGVRIARRTVTKYRESLRIERAQFRRRESVGPSRAAQPISGECRH